MLATAPDLPGCMADGETGQEALAEMADAMYAWIETAKELGHHIPKPSIPSNHSGQWRIRVPKHLHAALSLKAKEEGVSLNMLSATLLAEGIGKRLSSHDETQKRL